jgi:hypothetical protein
MKLVIGDMSFEEGVPDIDRATYTYEAYQPAKLKAHAILTERMGLFLAHAERCYIARYQERPERSTVEEF